MYLALTLFQIGVGVSLSFIHISLMSILTIILLHYLVVIREENYLKKPLGMFMTIIFLPQEDGFDCICF